MRSPNDIVAVESKQHSSEPSSPSSSPSDQEHRPFDVEEEHQILHLVPYTWSEFLELEPPPGGNYDYVDGLVVYCPHMANKGHNRIADSHKTVLQSKNASLYTYLAPSLQVITEKGKRLWTIEELRRSDGASSSTQPIEDLYGLRHPDYVITSTRRDSTGSTGPKDSKIEWPYPYHDKLKTVVEITSDSTRSVDLHTKWAAYARSNVPLYVILDRGTATFGKKVIVGSLKQFSKDLKRMAHGDPDPSKRRKPMPNDEDAIYYRKVYNSHEKVDCPYFNKLDMTVKQLLDEDHMRKLSKESHHEQTRQKERADTEEKRADEATKRADKEKKRADEATKRAEEATKSAEEERKSKDKEKKRADEATKSAEEEKKSKDKEKKRTDKLQKEIEFLKKSKEKATGKGHEELHRKSSGASSSKSPTSSSRKSPTQSPEKKKNRNK